MTVYMIADIKVSDNGWVPAYATSVHGLVHKHGGKYLARSGNVKTLEGKPLDTTLIALIRSRRSRRSTLSSPIRNMFRVRRPLVVQLGRLICQTGSKSGYEVTRRPAGGPALHRPVRSSLG